MPNAQVCMHLTIHITKLQLQTTIPKPLYIRHFACIYQDLGVENLDVCTTCDSWNNNIQLTMGIDWRRQIYPNVVECLTLTLVACDRKCHLNWKLITTQNKWLISPKGGHDDVRYEHTSPTLFPVMISTSMTRWSNLLTINLVPLHNPIDWLRLRNKRIDTPTLSSSSWFVISLNCKVFKNSIGYNESIETPLDWNLCGYCFLHLPSSKHGAFGNAIPHGPCIMHLATVLWANLFVF
jgi:hypothetical protein